MPKRFGVILLDSSEIVTKIYERNSKGSFVLLHANTQDLTSFDTNKNIDISEWVEAIAQTSLKWSLRHVHSWRIYARGIGDSTIKDISFATGIPIENLTLVQEQEFLCKGILFDMVTSTASVTAK